MSESKVAAEPVSATAAEPAPAAVVAAELVDAAAVVETSVTAESTTTPVIAEPPVAADTTETSTPIRDAAPEIVSAQPAVAAEQPSSEPSTSMPARSSSKPTVVEPTIAASSSAPEPSASAATASAEESAEKSTELWQTPNWPLSPDHPLRIFHARLPTILTSADHNKIWGVTLSSEVPAPFSTLLILQKFLRSTQGDLDSAAASLERTLKWRKEFGVDVEGWDGEIREEGDFRGLGYITVVPATPASGHEGAGKVEDKPAESGAEDTESKSETDTKAPPNKPEDRQIVTWNVYGAVRDIKSTFGNTERFLRWRVSLMERSMLRLHLATTSVPIPDLPSPDPHTLTQVHVYSGLSFLRLPAEVKAASKATIELMSTYYPETLGRKFFVGVPRVMSWVFAFVSLFVSNETRRKFSVVAWEEQLAELLGEGGYVPVRFGGTGPELGELEEKTKDM